MRTVHSRRSRLQLGLSLIEMMIALTIGLIISAALVSIFVNVSATNREQFKSAQQIENGRFAIDLLSNDIRLAGYYGEFSTLPSLGGFASLPDPCDVSPSATTSGRLKEGVVTSATLDSPLAFYVQGYSAASLTTRASVPATCQTWIDNASLKPGSDILVVRRFDTVPLVNPPTTSSATTTAGLVYVQAINGMLDVQYGGGGSIDTTKNARGAATDPALVRKDFSQATSGTPATRPKISAYIRALHTDIYYVSPCRSGSGSNGKCTAADDTIPTLKRLELTASGGVPTMTVVPLVEGIEYLNVTYGIDNSAILDGSVDSNVATPATMADWHNVVVVEVRIVARNNEATAGYNDTKTYNLGGGVTYTPSGTDVRYKRHTFLQKIYLPNVGGKRES